MVVRQSDRCRPAIDTERGRAPIERSCVRPAHPPRKLTQMQSSRAAPAVAELLPGRRPQRVAPPRPRNGTRPPAHGGQAEEGLRIAMLAPPWISVPPAGYGGVESVVSVLSEALVKRGNEVTLYCAPGSTSSADVVTLLDDTHPDEIERSLYEVRPRRPRVRSDRSRTRRAPVRRRSRSLRVHGSQHG